MATTTSGASSPDSVEALKRVKATENEWETKLSVARNETDGALARVRAESAAAVKDAQSVADQDRTSRVVRARADTAAEVETILAEGRKAADEATRGEGRRPVDKKDALLDVVLGTFRTE